MNPVLIIELITVAIIVTISLTQIILPALRGKPLFPFFRESELRRLQRENTELRLQQQVDKARKENLDLLLSDLKTPE